jgi:hypothetical protein
MRIAVLKGLVAELHGAIVVDEAPAGGTRLSIRIPRARR